MSKTNEPKFSASSIIAGEKIRIETRRALQATRGVLGTTGERKGTRSFDSVETIRARILNARKAQG